MTEPLSPKVVQALALAAREYDYTTQITAEAVRLVTWDQEELDILDFMCQLQYHIENLRNWRRAREMHSVP